MPTSPRTPPSQPPPTPPASVPAPAPEADTTAAPAAPPAPPTATSPVPNPTPGGRRRLVAKRTPGGELEQIVSTPRGVQAIAALGLVAVAGGSVGGLIYSLVLDHSGSAANSLSLIATSAVGGLLVLAGVRKNESE